MESFNDYQIVNLKNQNESAKIINAWSDNSTEHLVKDIVRPGKVKKKN